MTAVSHSLLITCYFCRRNYESVYETRKGSESETPATPTRMDQLQVTVQSLTAGLPHLPGLIAALVTNESDMTRTGRTVTGTGTIGRATRRGRLRINDLERIGTTMIVTTRTGIGGAAKMSTGLGGKGKLMMSH